VKTAGEAQRITASHLDPHSGDGWFVLHDVAVPRGAGSIDHLVVTPAGVFVVESLEWSRESSHIDGAPRHGVHLQRQELDMLRMAVRAVGEVLGSVLPDLAVEPTGVISLTGCPSSDEPWQDDGITAVAVGRLVRHLSKGPHPYDPERVEQLAVALDDGLVPCSGRSSSLVRPGPVLWPDPPGSTPPGTGLMATGPDAPRIGPTRPSELSGGEGWRAGGSTVKNVMRPLVAVLGVVLFFYFFATWSRALPRVTTGDSGASSAWAPSTAAIASLRLAWSCPRRGQGWTVALEWPTNTPPQPSLAEVSSSPHGPWTIKETAPASRRPALTGVRSGSSEWVRIGTGSGLTISDPIMAGRLVAPAGC
jgi:hypothetical protein